MNQQAIIRYSLLTALVAAALLLAGCSEDQGWVAVEYKGAPYGEGRTIGSGIKFVRAFMLDEKGPVVDPIMEEVNALLEQHEKMSMPLQDEVMTSAEPIFTAKQQK